MKELQKGKRVNTREGKPRVSVGLPTFNRVESLRTAIESVLAQDYPDLELVISDNASTDGTQQLCEAFARSDRRVRYFRQPQNRGATANFQEVLDRARGEFFMWLADDDWIDPSYISTCTRVLLRDPASVLAAGRVGYYEGARQLSEEPPLLLDSDNPRERVFRYFRRVGTNGTFYGVMRRSVLASVPIRPCLGGDWLLIASMALLGKVRTAPEVMAYRSVAGVSRDVAKLAASLGLPRVFQRNPHLYIALKAFQDITWESPVYRSLGAASRLLLAIRVFSLFMLRFYIAVPIRKLRSKLQESQANGSRVPLPGEANS
ncbi:MAG: glycosyltransferase family 2 protein [Longimicrobiaceae bacterium]